MKLKLIISLVAIILNIATAKAQNVNIPDTKFKAYLLADKAINTNGDNEIQVSEAKSFNDRIYVLGKEIKDFRDMKNSGFNIVIMNN